MIGSLKRLLRETDLASRDDVQRKPWNHHLLRSENANCSAALGVQRKLMAQPVGAPTLGSVPEAT